MNGCIVHKKHEFYDSFQFQEYGEVDVRNAIISASRINLDILVIDLDTAPVTAMLSALHTYRVQRPNTRIIILAPGRQPGDTEVAGIIALGIYDIVAPEDDEGVIPELTQVINNQPATYTQAARWLQLERSDKDYSNKGAGGQPKSRTEILVQQRPLGLTTIAVAGAGPGVGVSHLCLSVAYHLAKNNNRVVLAEWPIGEKKAGVESQYGCLSPLGAKHELQKAHGINIKMAHLNGFDIFLDARSFRSIEYVFPVIAQNSYDYLVLDLGELGPESPEKIAEMDRAALAVFAVNAAPYRIERFLPFIDEQDLSVYVPNLTRRKIALNLANDKEIKWFLDTFSKYVGKVYPIPYMANIIEQPDSIKDILQPVLPTNVVASKKPFSWLKAILKK